MAETVMGRAVVALDKQPQVVEIQVHPPGPGELRVRMGASGVCHTDWDLLKSGYTLMLGHEGAGTVDAVGEGVDDIDRGDRVLLHWAVACRECATCRRGLVHLCETWSPLFAPAGPGHAHLDSTTLDGRPVVRAFHLGSMSTHAVVRRAAVVPLPETIPFPSAAILGCGVQTGVGSVLNAADVRPGERVAVLGCGGVGLNVVQGARIAGAGAIVGVDVEPGRLVLAKQFGATHTVLASREDADLRAAAAEVKELLGAAPDYAFECTAVPMLGAAPLAMVRHGGTAIAVSGIEQRIEVDMRLFEWDKTYLNPLYGQCVPERDFPRLYGAYERGDLLLDELVTRTYALDEVARAFDDLLAGRNAKGVIVFDEARSTGQVG